MEITVNTLHNDVLQLRKELAYVKAHLEDIKLTQDDIDSLEEAKKDHKSGKTKRM